MAITPGKCRISHSLAKASVWLPYVILLYQYYFQFSFQWPTFLWLNHRLWSQGGHIGSGGWKSPSRVQKPDEHRQFAAVKCFSMQVCCLSPSSISPHPSPQKTSDLRESHDLKRPEQMSMCPPVAMLLLFTDQMPFLSSKRVCQST